MKSIKHLFTALLIIALNSANGQQMDKVFLDSSKNIAGHKIIHTSDSGYLTIGDAIESNKGATLIAKFNSSLSLMWMKKFKALNAGDEISSTDGFELTDKSFIILSNFIDSIPNTFIRRPAILRIDSAGNLIYAKMIYDSVFNYLINFSVNKIAQISDTTFYLAAQASGGSGSSVMIKMNIDGTIITTRSFRCKSSSSTSKPIGITSFANNTFVVSSSDFGIATSNNGGITNYCFDGNLNYLWSKHVYYDPYFLREYSIHTMDDSTFLINGDIQFNINPYISLPTLIKISNSGDIKWTNVYSTLQGSSPVWFIYAVPWKGKYLISGVNNNSLTNNPLLMEIDSSGNYVTAKSYPHNSYNWYTFWQIYPCTDSLILLNESQVNGNYGFGFTMVDSTLYHSCVNDSLSIQDSLIVLPTDTGVYFDLWVFPKDSDITSNFTSSFINPIEYDLCATTGIILNIDYEEFSIFPNPARGLLQIKKENYHDFNLDKITIYDIAGKKIKITIINDEPEQSIDISKLTPGMYFLSVNENYPVKKFIVE